MRKINKPSILFFIILPVFSYFTDRAGADDNWVARARLLVPKPGMVETILLPDLHFMPGGEARPNRPSSDMDLELIGPDQNPRAFELFWKEERGKRTFVLKPVNIELGDDFSLRWEGVIPRKIRADRIRVVISAERGVGRVNVQAMVDESWRTIAENAAIYRSGNKTQADVHIQPGEYQRFRLVFHGFDKKWHQTPLPVELIKVEGYRPGRGYAHHDFSPPFKAVDRKEFLEIRAVLPGSGIFLDNIMISTQARFQGDWSIGTEVIAAGKKRFEPVTNGSMFWVKQDEKDLTIRVNRRWIGKSIIVRLDTKGRFIGEIENLDIRARVPRLVFHADVPGPYLVRTGIDKPARIRSVSGDQSRRIDHQLGFVDAEKNENWRPVDYVEKYAVRGGPFILDGYTWKASVPVPDRGLYRLVLNREACMEPNQAGLRLALDGVQIPYFDGAGETRNVVLGIDPDYDAKKNRTVWEFQLSRSRMKWSALEIAAGGIFNRQVTVEIHKPGQIGWKPWKTLRWVNRTRKEARLKIDMNGFPDAQKTLRLTMDHGDNQPLALSRITAQYPARSLIFLARKPGMYELMGGHPKAAAPEYDLSLVQDIILGIEPKQVEMVEVMTFKGPGLGSRVTRVFSHQGWGLYLVLGLVTCVLLVVIVRLFPKEDQKQ